MSIKISPKCKHCIFFKYGNIIKEDGSTSSKMVACCTNVNSDKYNELLSIKSQSCEKIELLLKKPPKP